MKANPTVSCNLTYFRTKKEIYLGKRDNLVPHTCKIDTLPLNILPGLKTLVFVCFFGSYPMMLNGYSWLFSQEVLLVVLEDHMG